MPAGPHGWHAAPGTAPLPYGAPGPMTPAEHFMFETCGFLIVPGALSPAVAAEMLAAAERAHSNEEFVTKQLDNQGPPGERNGEHSAQEEKGLLGCWRQLDNVWEAEPCFEPLIDHSSVIEKVRALFGDSFILHSSWNTMVPAGFEAGFGFHQDGTGSYSFNMLGNHNGLAGDGGPTPLVQLRIAFVLTDLSEPGAGNLALVSETSRVHAACGREGHHHGVCSCLSRSQA